MATAWEPTDANSLLLGLCRRDVWPDEIELEVEHWQDPRALQPDGEAVRLPSRSLLGIVSRVAGVRQRTLKLKTAGGRSTRYSVRARRTQTGVEIVEMHHGCSEALTRPATMSKMDVVGLLDPTWILSGWTLDFLDSTRISETVVVRAERRDMALRPSVWRIQRAEMLLISIRRSDRIIVDQRAFAGNREFDRLRVLD